MPWVSVRAARVSSSSALHVPLDTKDQRPQTNRPLLSSSSSSPPLVGLVTGLVSADCGDLYYETPRAHFDNHQRRVHVMGGER